MGFSSTGQDISKVQKALETANDISHAHIIKQASEDLFALFTDHGNKHAEVNLSNGETIDHKKDLEILAKLLEEKKKILANPESISNDEIGKTYDIYETNGTVLPDKIEKKENVKKKLKRMYTDSFKKYLKTLPNEVLTIRKSPDFDFSDFEITRRLTSGNINQLCTTLEAKKLFDAAVAPELKIKLAKLLILFSQVVYFIDKGETREHYEAAIDVVRKIEDIFGQLEAHQHIDTSKKQIEDRIQNIDKLEKSHAHVLPKEELEKGTAKTISFPLKNLFFTAGLEELPGNYTLKNLTIKDKNNKDTALFADDKGVAIAFPLTTGTTQSLFVKEDDTYIALGSISVHDSAVDVTFNAYETLSNTLACPIDCTMNIQGIGATPTSKEHPVALTRDIVLTADKPSFKSEYNKIEREFDLNQKLETLFDAQYDAQLKDRFYEVVGKDPRTKKEWEHLNGDQKHDFFTNIKNGTNLPWSPRRTVPFDIKKAGCYNETRFQDDVRTWILKEFTGKTEADLKKFLFEKLGIFDFTEIGKNPYAIKVLSDKIKEKFESNSGEIFFLLNNYSLSLGSGTHTAEEEKLADDSLAGEKEIDAAVADSKEIYKESAYERANKELEFYYKGSAKFSLKRAKVFFFRDRMVKKAIARDIKEKKGLSINDTSNAAVNRWMLEQAMGGEFAKNIHEDTTIFEDTVFQDRLTTLVQSYLTNNESNADSTFATQIQDLIMSNSQLRFYMKEHKITHLGTNLVEQARSEKEERNYYGKLIATIDQYTREGRLNTPQEFDVQIRKQLADFAQKQNKLPDMVKHLKLDIDAVDFAEKLAQHKTTLERMKARNIKLRLKLLTNKSEESIGLTSAQHIDRDKFDATHAKKLTKFMEKHPRWTTSLTAIGLVGSGVAGALTMPVIGVGVGAGLLWYTNFLKKKGHYTEEHKKFEQHLLAMNPQERERYLEELKEKSDKMPKRMRWCFPSEYTKYGRSLEYLQSADSMEKIMGDLDRYIQKPTAMNTPEHGEFARYLQDALTLLKMHKLEGRNFVYGEKGKERIEELYNQLHQKTVAGLRRYDSNQHPEKVIEDIMNDTSITTHTNVEGLGTSYSEQKKDMANMRNKLGIFAGSKSAGIYLASAWGAGWIKNQIADGWHHVFGTHAAAPTVINTPVTTSVGLDPAFGLNAAGQPDGHLLLQNVFDNDPSKYQHFVDKFQHLTPGDKSTTLRGTLKDIFGSDQIANQKTHQIFNQFAANITDKSVAELVAQGANVNLHSAQQIGQLMAHRGYSGINSDPSHIQSLINGLKSGSFDLNHLPTGWTKETACNALFCNTQGHQLTDLFFDSVTQGGTSTTGAVAGAAPARSNFLPFGLPTFFNDMRNKK